ncbi:MAG: hypothetical protein JW942_02330 [Opitutales bacterium]|nr:hypothetical protein [Opitutales bacterium]
MESAHVRWADLTPGQKLCTVPLTFTMFIVGLFAIALAFAIVAAPLFAVWYFFVRSQ